MGRSVHYLSIGKRDLHLQSGNIFKAFHGEVIAASMIFISLEGFNEKDRLQERGGYLDDLSPFLDFGDMEDLPIWVKIMSVPLFTILPS